MTRRGTIETAFQIARTFIYGDSWHTNAAWCERCASYVPLVTLTAAAELDKTTPEAIVRRMDSGELHFAEGSAPMFVCLGSLIDAGADYEEESAAARKQFTYIRPAAA